MANQDLEKRIQKLEDIEEIKKLKALYGEICDDGYNIERMKQIFTDDAVWDGGETWGIYKGKQEIIDFFAEAGENITGVHFFIQPKIEIISDSIAKGSWYLLQQGDRNGMGFWLSAIEYEKYVKIDGKWYYKEIKFRGFFATRYEEGWHKEKMCL